MLLLGHAMQQRVNLRIIKVHLRKRQKDKFSEISVIFLFYLMYT